MAWGFVPGLGASNSGLHSHYRDTGLSAGLNGISVQPLTLRRAWKTKPWIRRLSGLTCEPSTAQRGVDAWISSLRDSRASHSASLDSSGDTMTPGTYGHTSPGSLARYALSGPTSKTSQASLQPSLLTDAAPSTTSWVTSKEWVTRSRGTSSARQRWGRAIAGSASSSWPTPAEDDRSNVSGDVNRDYQSLAREAASWPTPRAEDSESTGQHGAAVDTLTAAMRMWQTPASDSFRSRGGDRKDEMGLDQQARFGMWATPAARSVKGGYSEEALTRQDGKSRMDILDNQAVYWATPTRGDVEKTTERMREDRQNSLNAMAVSGFPSSLPAPASTGAGQPSSGSTPASRRRLNPAFVEWLMGWPPGWTDLDSPFSAMELYRWSQRTRSWLCALGWRVE